MLDWPCEGLGIFFFLFFFRGQGGGGGGQLLRNTYFRADLSLMNFDALFCPVLQHARQAV